MINQYRIGRSLGKGAYAKVELGVDVGTGKEYVRGYGFKTTSVKALTSLGDQRVFKVAVALPVPAGEASPKHAFADEAWERFVDADADADTWRRGRVRARAGWGT
jgi:serine/threonine protein kinase